MDREEGQEDGVGQALSSIFSPLPHPFVPYRAVSAGKSVQKARHHLGLGRLPLILVYLREKHRGLSLLFDLDSYQVREIEGRLYNRQNQKKTAQKTVNTIIKCQLLFEIKSIDRLKY